MCSRSARSRARPDARLRRVLSAALAAVALIGAAAAEPVSYGYLSFEPPPGWRRNDEAAYASFSPADEPGVTLAIFLDLGDDGAEDALEAFVARAEAASGGAREAAEEVEGGAYKIWRQDAEGLDELGAAYRRHYVALSPDGRDTAIVFGGDRAAFARWRAEAAEAIRSIAVTDGEAASPWTAAPDALPGEGGLDGLYVARQSRPFISAEDGGWSRAERLDFMAFDELGGVYRGAPQRLGAALFEGCAPAWRCGRYRVLNDEIVLRWADGTAERLGFRRTEDGTIRLGATAMARVKLSAAPPVGAFVYRNRTNRSDWPSRDADGEPLALVANFGEDGRFTLSGFTGFGAPRFGRDVETAGRYRTTRGEMTLVSAGSSSDVVTFAPLPGDGGEIVIGGRVFAPAHR